MNKEEFLRDVGRALDEISEAERTEILYDYEEHFMIGKENGKTEEEICLELGNPAEIANNYLSSHSNENIEFATKTETKENNSFNTVSYHRNLYVAFAIIAGILIYSFVNYVIIPKHNNSIKSSSNDGVQVGGIRIDSTGIHGDGISIDSDGVKAPGVNIDDKGVKVPGVTIDDNGVKAPGVSIDDNGVKVPGVSIDGKGVKVNLPNVNINIRN
jgi:hypothetical protein